jgi:hypothetical protein
MENIFNGLSLYDTNKCVDITDVCNDLEEILSLVSGEEQMPFTLSNKWRNMPNEQEFLQTIDYVKYDAINYLTKIQLEKNIYHVYPDVLQAYVNYYLELLCEDYSFQFSKKNPLL